MKLSSLIRRMMPSPQLRAGVPPTWDRPDPPTHKKSKINRRVSILLCSTQWRKNIFHSLMGQL